MADSSQRLRIATRASDLALWQAKHVRDILRANDEHLDVELVTVSTHGDREQKEALHQMGGQGVFTREVQRAVLENQADIAVHSLKDLPTQPTEGLRLASVPARASVFDALVLPADGSPLSRLEELSEGARVGTGSLRRQAQLRHRRPDLKLVEIRGNVPTRLKKLDKGDYDALLLAVAGLERLGLAERISMTLGPPEMYPAVGQGALGIECRVNDDAAIRKLAALTNPHDFAAVTAERALLAELEAGCHAPLGALSQIAGEQLTLRAVVLDPQGKNRIEGSKTATIENAESLGRKLARELLKAGAAEML